MLRELIHTLVYRHSTYIKPGVGVITACGRRLGKNVVISFVPDLPDKVMYSVSGDLLDKVLSAETAAEAAAVIHEGR